MYDRANHVDCKSQKHTICTKAEKEDFITRYRVNKEQIPKISIDDPKVISAAKFAVEELKQLSDSGVYKSLSLSNIVKAEEQNGV